MKKPEEIKKDAETCLSHPSSMACNYCCLYDECDGTAEYIIKELYDLAVYYESRLAQVERERDAAVHDVHSLCATNYFSGDYCEYCKYREPDGQCFHDCTPYSSKWGWEWRGVCPENTKEEK